MSHELMGVSLTRLEDPIREALNTYREISWDALGFDGDKAGKLELTRTKPYSARSESDVIYFGEIIGKLYVIAFKPGDGTGSEADYKLKDLEVDPPYPREPRVVPRKKTDVRNEGHFTVVRHKIEDVHAEPEVFGGTYDLLGLEGNRVKKIGELGHPKSQNQFSPVVTYTVGYPQDAVRYHMDDEYWQEKFGDPHAVYSGMPDFIQICAFLAVSNELNSRYSGILKGLGPQLPRP